jgi:hypothetical protein
MRSDEGVSTVKFTDKGAEYLMYAAFWVFLAALVSAFICDDIMDSWADKICIEAIARQHELVTCKLYASNNLEYFSEIGYPYPSEEIKK